MPIEGTFWGKVPQPYTLPFPDLWQRATPVLFSYTKVIKLTHAGPQINAFQEKLNSTRDAAMSESADPKTIMSRINEHLVCLTYLIANTDRLVNKYALARVSYKWVSAMCPPNVMGPYIIHLEKCLLLDQCMWIFRSALAAWQAAQDRSLDIFSDDSTESNSQAVNESLRLLCQSAGMFQHLADHGWDDAVSAGWHPNPARAPEAHPWFAGACAKVVLGQAQYLAAYFSFCKGNNYTMTAKLYVGASDFFEAAAAAVRKAEADRLKPPNDRFKRFIALKSAMSVALARCAEVRVLLSERKASTACVLAKHAQDQLNLCNYVSFGEGAWSRVFNELGGEVKAMLKECESDRDRVYMQNISRESPPELPAGISAVFALPFVVPQEDLNVVDGL